VRHILTSRTEHKNVQSQGRSTYPFLLRITAHLGFTNPGRQPRERAVTVASCLPAQKPSGWLPSVGWQLGSPCRWLPVGSCNQVASGHGPLARYKVLAYARGRKHERCDGLGQIKSCQIRRPRILDMRDFLRWRKIKKAQQQPNLQPDELLFSLSSSATHRTIRVLESPSLLLTNRISKPSWLIPGFIAALTSADDNSDKRC